MKQSQYKRVVIIILAVGVAISAIIGISSVARAQLPPPPPPPVVPAAPTGLTATPISTTEIDLSWNANTDMAIARYIIYRDGVNIATVSSGTSYQNTGLSANTAYSYTVSAVSATWEYEGDQSTAVTATTSTRLYTISDFTILVTDWLKTITSAADVNSDGTVNTRDLGIMMSHWSNS